MLLYAYCTSGVISAAFIDIIIAVCYILTKPLAAGSRSGQNAREGVFQCSIYIFCGYIRIAVPNQILASFGCSWPKAREGMFQCSILYIS